jgi:hypothetical protein
MASPPPPRSSGPKWIWVALIVVLAFLLITVFFNPSGDRDGTVQDPIVMDDPGQGTGVGQGNDADEANQAPAPEPFAPGGEPSD